MSLKGHYDAHKPDLDEKTHNIVESLETQAKEQHSFLSEQLKATAGSVQSLLLIWQGGLLDNVEDLLPLVGSRRVKLPILAWHKLPKLPQRYSRAKETWDVIKKRDAILEEHKQEILQAAKAAKDWDIQGWLRALDAEVERIVGARS